MNRAKKEKKKEKRKKSLMKLCVISIRYLLSIINYLSNLVSNHLQFLQIIETESNVIFHGQATSIDTISIEISEIDPNCDN